MKLPPVKGKKAFNELKDSKQRAKGRNFSVVYAKSEVLGVSFVITKKIGGAVVRNSIKRRLRAAILDEVASLLPGSYLIIVYKDLSGENYLDLKTELLKTMKKSFNSAHI